MLSVIIPTLDAAESLPRTLYALIPAVISGLIKDVCIVDGGSKDATVEVADAAGCNLYYSAPGRGRQLALGAKAARADWFLFLHADTVLSPGWEQEVAHFTEQKDSGDFAGVFRFSLDDFRPAARRLETMVALRCKLLALPYGDQGLIIHRKLYEALGGYDSLPLMEDVEFIRRIGRKRLIYLQAAAQTSAKRYQTDGYWLRPLRNLFCLSLYFLRFPPALIARLYG